MNKRILACGCCGKWFTTDKEFPGHDKGYGDCPRCKKDQTEVEEKVFEDAIKAVEEAISEENANRFKNYTRERQKEIILELMDRGAIGWQIKK